ncbi:MAG: DUF4202 domain-containing protein, partial [Verrucomicrobiota bacterium]
MTNKILRSLANPDRFVEAIRRFDEANAQDPNLEIVGGKPMPRELAYAQRLTAWVLKLNPDASEILLLAARSQHLCRWTIPRSDYELTRAGYLRWRNDLKKFHADKAGRILQEVGYPPEVIREVQALNLKQNFPKDPQGRILEDALCLVFLEHQFADLARKTSEDKMINAVQKTWNKMTPSARLEAMKLPYGDAEKALLTKALAPIQS